MSKAESRIITSYDVIKTVAVMTMILDHLGLYLWPEAEMLRAIGRLSAPMWFFLIGFARTRDVPFSWVFWMGIDLALSVYLGLGARPNVFLTLILLRLSLDMLGPILYPRSHFTIAFMVLCLVMTPLVRPFMEYGSYAWLLAAVGYWVRQDGAAGIKWIAAVFFGYFAIQSFNMNFGDAEMIVFAGGMICVAAALTMFSPDAKMTSSSGLTAGIYHLCGRYSLVIYAFHLLALKIIWFSVQ